jgi:hypothetical protein
VDEKPKDRKPDAPASGSRQPVDKVPEEALTLLAREIVREAGIAQDPARTALLENDKARAEMFRTMTILTTALLAGMGGVAAVLPSPWYYVWFLSTAVWFDVGAILTSLFGMIVSSMLVGALDFLEDVSEEAAEPTGWWWSWGSKVILTHPLKPGEPLQVRMVRRMRRSRDRIALASVVLFGAALLLFMTFAMINLRELAYG